MAICKVCGYENKNKPDNWINWECGRCFNENLPKVEHSRDKFIEKYIDDEWHRLKRKDSVNVVTKNA